MNAIEIKGLCKSYTNFNLKDISITLPSGCVMGLVGENGAGKTTLIRLIMGAANMDSGEITVLNNKNGKDNSCKVKDRIGVVLDETCYPECLDAHSVAKIMRYTYSNWDDVQFKDYLDRFKVSPDKKIKDYSRGMKMKLSIAAALSHNAELLILDEATSGLDPITRDEILDVFNNYTRREDHSILMSSHILSDLEKICDYIALMHNGRLILCEEKDRLLEKYAMVSLNKEDFKRIPSISVRGSKRTPYGIQALVERSEIPDDICPEHTNIEDVILFLTKEVMEK